MHVCIFLWTLSILLITATYTLAYYNALRRVVLAIAGRPASHLAKLVVWVEEEGGGLGGVPITRRCVIRVSSLLWKHTQAWEPAVVHQRLLAGM